MSKLVAVHPFQEHDPVNGPTVVWVVKEHVPEDLESQETLHHVPGTVAQPTDLLSHPLVHSR